MENQADQKKRLFKEFLSFVERFDASNKNVISEHLAKSLNNRDVLPLRESF